MLYEIASASEAGVHLSYKPTNNITKLKQGATAIKTGVIKPLQA